MLDGKPRELASGKHFAVLSTLNQDGSIQSHPMWCDVDDNHILINTEVHRAKFKNMQRNPNITVLVQETGNPWSWSEVRGKVVETVTGPRRATISTSWPRSTWVSTTIPIRSSRSGCL